MTATAEKLPEENKQSKALSLFDIKEKVFADIESYTALEIVDTTTENDVRKARMVVRDLRYKIQNAQKEKNAELNRKKKDIKDYAELLIARINPTETDLDTKIKAVEAEREAKRLEKERIEQERIEAIDLAMESLNNFAMAGLEYNRVSTHIKGDLAILFAFEVTEDVFQERFDEAVKIKERGLEQTKKAFDARLIFEKEQAEQEAKAKKLAEEQAAFEAKQKAAQDAADKKAKEAAEKQRKIEEKNRLEREALEKKEAEIKEREQRQAEIKYHSDWYDAIQHNISLLWDEAHQMNAEFDRVVAEEKAAEEKARKEKLKADKARAKLIKADKESLKQISLYFYSVLSDVVLPDLKTEESKEIVLDLTKYFEEGLHNFDNSVEGLA